MTRYHIIIRMFDTFLQITFKFAMRKTKKYSSQTVSIYLRENNLHRYSIKEENEFVHSARYSIVCFTKKYFSNTRI